jgi:ATP-dependent DNA ligase
VKHRAACQLLTAIDDGNEAAAKLLDPNYAVQQKFDGKRIMLHIERSSVTAHNREGLICSVSPNIIAEARQFAPIAPMMLDGEWIRETKTLHAFDLLEINGTDIRPWKFIDRNTQLMATLQAASMRSIQIARTEFEQAGKIDLLQEVHARNLEGIVLKKIDSPYRTDRQPDQFKHKFTVVSSFVITKKNEKDSVALGLFNDKGQLIECGNVKIRSKHFRVNEGMVIDVRYLHAFRDSNHVYQPRMVAIRDDLQPEHCLISQLKYKGQ